MKQWIHGLALVCAAAGLAAEEPVTNARELTKRTVEDTATGTTPATAPETKIAEGNGTSPWLGLRVAKVVPELRSQVPELPPGVGFTVESLDTGGPADAAGLRRHDIIWRMEGQFLVNEAQLAVLLGLKRPGQEVEIEYFRAAKPQKLKLTLGAAPPGFLLSVDEVGERVVISPPDRAMPVRIVDVPSRTASIENIDGKAVLVRTEKGYGATISAPDGRTLWEGPVPFRGSPDKAPVAWRERIESLRNALDQASPCHRRVPRLRILPPPQVPTANKDS